MHMRYLVALLIGTAVASSLSARAAPSISSLPGCEHSIGPHLATGCQMRGAWYDGDAEGSPSKTAVTVARRHTATARAIVPLDANLQGDTMTYAVRFSAHAADRVFSLVENLRVNLWIADDQNRNAVHLRAAHLSVNQAGKGTITVEAKGVDIGFQPHYVYVSFGAHGPLFADDDVDGSTAIRVEDVAFFIHPTR